MNNIKTIFASLNLLLLNGDSIIIKTTTMVAYFLRKCFATTFCTYQMVITVIRRIDNLITYLCYLCFSLLPVTSPSSGAVSFDHQTISRAPSLVSVHVLEIEYRCCWTTPSTHVHRLDFSLDIFRRKPETYLTAGGTSA